MQRRLATMQRKNAKFYYELSIVWIILLRKFQSVVTLFLYSKVFVIEVQYTILV